VTSWPSGNRRARASRIAAVWFSPQRWSSYDVLIALASLVLAVSPFLPWYSATVHLRNSSLSGVLIDPAGTLRGIAVHPYLWAIFGLGLLNLVVLAAHNAPDGRALKLPGLRPFLIATSVLGLAVALVAFVMKPGTWPGNLNFGGVFTLVIGWSYGAIAAVSAALLSAGVGVAATRD
jgi:hypothetical protein